MHIYFTFHIFINYFIWLIFIIIYISFPWWLSQWRVCLQCWRPGFYPWFGKIPWRRKWQPTPVFLPGEFHGQRSLVGYSPWDHKELDTTEQLTFHFHFILVLIFFKHYTMLCFTYNTRKDCTILFRRNILKKKRNNHM